MSPAILQPHQEIPLALVDLGVLNGIKDVETLYAGAVYDKPSIDGYEQGLRLRGELTPVMEQALEKARMVRSENRVVFYIAGGLTGVDEETKLRYGQVSELIASLSCEENGRMFGYVPHLHGTDPKMNATVSPRDVRNVDYLWAVIMADFHINFLHPQAHGNAIEGGWAERGLIPAVFLNLIGNKLSRLTKGLNNVFAEIEYSNNAEMLMFLRQELLKIDAWLKAFPGVDPRYYFYMNSPVLRDLILRLHELNPAEFNPVFNVKDCVGYVENRKSPYVGEVLDILAHGSRESVDMYCKLQNGDLVSIPDSHITTWFNPTLFN